VRRVFPCAAGRAAYTAIQVDPVTVRAWAASLSWSHVPPFSGGTAVVVNRDLITALLAGQYLGVPPDPPCSHSRMDQRCRVTLP